MARPSRAEIYRLRVKILRSNKNYGAEKQKHILLDSSIGNLNIPRHCISLVIHEKLKRERSDSTICLANFSKNPALIDAKSCFCEP
jgi:hypothetical protein